MIAFIGEEMLTFVMDIIFATLMSGNPTVVIARVYMAMVVLTVLL